MSFGSWVKDLSPNFRFQNNPKRWENRTNIDIIAVFTPENLEVSLKVSIVITGFDKCKSVRRS